MGKRGFLCQSCIWPTHTSSRPDTLLPGTFKEKAGSRANTTGRFGGFQASRMELPQRHPTAGGLLEPVALAQPVLDVPDKRTGWGRCDAEDSSEPHPKLYHRELTLLTGPVESHDQHDSGLCSAS